MNNLKKSEAFQDLNFISETEQKQKEQDIRTWISKKESVCPYAPGLAHFVHLPDINSLSMRYVYYLAAELKFFYAAKENNKRVGRWMLMPQREWVSHEDAHQYAERIFWLLNAAHYHLCNNKNLVRASLEKTLKGYKRGYQGEILNPVIGKLPNRNKSLIPPKSLFYSALSPLYKSKRFYRYSPHSLMPLVYASEFEELRIKHSKVTKTVTFDMALGGLCEVFGDDIHINVDEFRKELPIWGAMIDRAAEVMRAQSKGVSSLSPEVKGCPGSNLSYFRVCPTQFINKLYLKYEEKLSILKTLTYQHNTTPKHVINASFAGSGLYTIPEYVQNAG